jgi:hypothetical protein
MTKSSGERWEYMDKRILEKKIRKGEITEKELKAFLRRLPDLSKETDEVPAEPKRKGKL